MINVLRDYIFEGFVEVCETYFAIYESLRPHFPTPCSLCQMFVSVSHECKLHTK